MAISNFIPTIWSENLYTELNKKYIGVANCNREFEGEIRQKGDRVNICGVGSVSVFDYTKDTDMTTPQVLSDSIKTLLINQAKGFNFQIDDIDSAQATPKLMNAAMKVAANALANTADSYIYSLYTEALSTNTVTNDAVTASNIVSEIIKARTKLYSNNVTDSNDIVVEVTPEIAELILNAKIDLSTENSSALESGLLGRIGGCKIYVTSNIKTVMNEDDILYHKCFVRTKRAIAYAEQLSEICAYRPEKRFADAVKGLHLYGAKVVYPSELVLLDVALQ